MRDRGVQQVMENYPRIYFACHTRHVRDPKTRRLVSAHQVSILDHLDEREATALVDLARHMGVTVSTMSLNVERLVRKGYVRRTRDPKDRRRLQLLVTSAGMRLRDASTVLEPERISAMLNELDSGERTRLGDDSENQRPRKRRYDGVGSHAPRRRQGHGAYV